MVILNLDAGGIKAAQIEKPDISYDVARILTRKYSIVYAEKYAKMIANFFKDNMKFPGNAIYRITGGKFYILDLTQKLWSYTGLSKEDFVIPNEVTDFWNAYDKKFGFLEEFRSEIGMLIYDVTENMFDKKPTDIRYIEVRENSIVCKKGIGSAISNVFKEHIAESALEDYAQSLLVSIFGCDEYPIFLIKDGLVHCAITSENIIPEYDANKIRTYIESSFMAEDVRNVVSRLHNIIVYGIDSPYEIIELNPEGNPIYYFNGLKIVDYQNQDGMFGIFMDKENANRLFEILKSIGSDSLKKMKDRHSDLEVPIDDGYKYVSIWFYMREGDDIIYLSNIEHHSYSVAKLGDKGLKQVALKYHYNCDDKADNDEESIEDVMSPHIILAYFD